MSLNKKFFDAITSKAVITNKGTGDVYAANECARICLKEQIKGFQELLEDYMKGKDALYGTTYDKIRTRITALETTLKELK